jgi:hypothetical protein
LVLVPAESCGTYTDTPIRPSPLEASFYIPANGMFFLLLGACSKSNKEKVDKKDIGFHASFFTKV